MENLNDSMNYDEMDQSMFFDDYQYEQQSTVHDEIEITDSEVASLSSSTSNKKHRSWVWEHFTFDENLKKPQCNYCKIHVSANKSSTTGMSKHVKNKHPLKLPKNNQLTLHETIENIPILVS